MEWQYAVRLRVESWFTVLIRESRGSVTGCMLVVGGCCVVSLGFAGFHGNNSNVSLRLHRQVFHVFHAPRA